MNENTKRLKNKIQLPTKNNKHAIIIIKKEKSTPVKSQTNALFFEQQQRFIWIKCAAVTLTLRKRAKVMMFIERLEDGALSERNFKAAVLLESISSEFDLSY